MTGAGWVADWVALAGWEGSCGRLDSLWLDGSVDRGVDAVQRKTGSASGTTMMFLHRLPPMRCPEREGNTFSQGSKREDQDT